MRKLLLAAVASLGIAGCYTTGTVGAGYSSGGYYGGGGYYAEPQLYYYGPGVSVVAYSDDPVFYSDGYYWRYYGGTWYSSSYYGGGWTLAYNVPYGVRTIRQPHTYARFQPGQGWTRVNARGGYYNNGGAPVVRDHRSGYNPPAGRTYTPPAQTQTRDHRSAPVYSPPASSSGGTRDHRSSQPSQPSPPRGNGPTVRDHRKK